MTVRRIISGGQTGVDQAALRWALDRGYEIGGLAPKGFATEDGLIPEEFAPHMTALTRGARSGNTRSPTRTRWVKRSSHGLTRGAVLF